MAAGPPVKKSFEVMEEERCIGSATNQVKQQSTSSPATTSAPQKKKRNLPGTPNPDAEVIALSPKTLMATNRFICEVCNKGFQREQNLQLHRRGHNLPWKLRQKSNKEVKKKVYLCPEPTCVHHDPSRALGDLTGIKKHYSRKHGEKKWKCEKCSKKYAVQSDWKAHSKTCGTREYRCDCGTLFSRRDSFITHRAFCDALAQESARLPTGLSTIAGQLYNNSSSNSVGLGLSQIGSLADQTHSSANILRLGGAGATQFDQLLPPNFSFRSPQPPPSFFSSCNGGGGSSNQDFHEDAQAQQGLLQSKPPTYPGLMQLPDLSSNSTNSSAAKVPNNVFSLSFLSQNSNGGNKQGDGRTNVLLQDQFSGSIMSDHMTSSVPSLYNSQLQVDTVVPQMSATALLQKAAQLGATTSAGNQLRTFNSSTPKGTTSHDTSSAGIGLQWQEQRPPSSPSSSSLPTATQSPPSSRTQLLPTSLPIKGLDQMRANVSIGQETHFQEFMNSLVNGSSSMFGGDARGIDEFVEYNGSHRMNLQLQHRANHVSNLQDSMEGKLHQNGGASSSNVAGTDEMTRDFLGVGGMSRGFIGGGFTHRDQQQHHTMNLVSFDSEMKSLARSYSERMQ
ncbi:zinc finger protein BALDIBIS-like [Nymphaea colorata]|nr:zinc finger protein BALDIBIS-like [Nymphaea colorata]